MRRVASSRLIITVLHFPYWLASGVAWETNLRKNCFPMKGHYNLDLTPSQKAESHTSFWKEWFSCSQSWGSGSSSIAHVVGFGIACSRELLTDFRAAGFCLHGQHFCGTHNQWIWCMLSTHTRHLKLTCGNVTCEPFNLIMLRTEIINVVWVIFMGCLMHEN